MNEEEFNLWLEKIQDFMKADEESKEFIKYVCEWFYSMSGSEEALLLMEYHPTINTEEDAYKLIELIRGNPLSVIKNKKDFKNHMFDSAFLLYKQFLKLKFIKEKNEI